MSKNITIKRYDEDRDAKCLFALMQAENDWGDYLSECGMKKYKAALNGSIVYVLYEGVTCCGFIRAKDDFGFWVNVYDLLVGKTYRGNDYGKMLIDEVCKNFDTPVSVMSDADGYYKGQGFAKIIGSVIELQGKKD